MRIDEFYTLTNDSNGWTLKFEEFTGKLTKNGNPSKKTHTTYHGTLLQALTRYLDDCLKASESVEEIHQKIEEALVKIEIILKP